MKFGVDPLSPYPVPIFDEEHQNYIGDERLEELEADKARLDFLQSQTKVYGKGWLLRASTSGRVMRLHETSQEGAQPTVREAIDEAMALGVDKESAKRYYVDFYDMFDGWGTWGFWPERLFNDFDEAKSKCDELQAKLNKSNKECGEHYGVIDSEKNREIYCTRQSSDNV